MKIWYNKDSHSPQRTVYKVESRHHGDRYLIRCLHSVSSLLKYLSRKNSVGEHRGVGTEQIL